MSRVFEVRATVEQVGDGDAYRVTMRYQNGSGISQADAVKSTRLSAEQHALAWLARLSRR